MGDRVMPWAFLGPKSQPLGEPHGAGREAGRPTLGLEKPLSSSRVCSTGFVTQMENLAGEDELGVTSLLVTISLRVCSPLGPPAPREEGGWMLWLLALTVPSRDKAEREPGGQGLLVEADAVAAAGGAAWLTPVLF